MRAVDKKINPLILPYDLINELRDQCETKEEILFLLYYYFNNAPSLALRQAQGKTKGQPAQEEIITADIYESKFNQLIQSLNQQMEIDPDQIDIKTINRMAFQDRALAISRNRADVSNNCTRFIAELNGMYNNKELYAEDNSPKVVAYIPSNSRDADDNIKDAEIIATDNNEAPAEPAPAPAPPPAP